MGRDGMWRPGCQGSLLALHLPLCWPQDNLWETGSDSHQYLGLALAHRRAPRRTGANRTLPLSLRMPSMLCLAFLSPSSTSFLSNSASSSSPFPHLLRRMRLMELTSGGECRAVTGSSPAAPRGSGAGPGSRVPNQCHCLCPSATAGRDLGKAAALSRPGRGFTGPAPHSCTGTAIPENLSFPRGNGGS